MKTLQVQRSGQRTFQSNGVIAKLSADSLHIRLSQEKLATQNRAMIGTLWEMWLSEREKLLGGNVECVVDVSAFETFPRPLLSVLSAIDWDLGKSGRELRVVARGQKVYL